MINTNTPKKFAIVTECFKNYLETDEKNNFCDSLNIMNSKIKKSILDKDKTLAFEILGKCNSIGKCKCTIEDIILEKNEIHFSILNINTNIVVDKGFIRFPFDHNKKETVARKVSNFLSLYYGNDYSEPSLKEGYIDFVNRNNQLVSVSEFLSSKELIDYIDRLDFSVYYQVKNTNSNPQVVSIDYSSKEFEMLEYADYLIDRIRTHNVQINIVKNPIINLLFV